MADALHALAEPLGAGFVQHALIAIAVLSVVGGVLGCWIVLYGVSYAAESLAHGLLPGLVAATLLGLPLLVGGAVGVALAALAIALAARIRGLERDTAIGVVITAVFGLGVLLALAPASPPGIDALLFGDVLGISSRQLAVSALAAAALVGLLAVSHRRLLAVGFDRTAAGALGARPRLTDALLLLLVAAAVVVAVQALGSLLAVAALVAPAAGARLLTRRVVPLMAVATALGLAGGIAGLALSWWAGTAAGASIALSLVALYALAAGVGSLRRRASLRAAA
jgi:ABC-type Mn2+/Zn2+ transport system permease subunit